ncbi:MAG: hypothetical protein LBR61_08130, partial [Synergistaceae bacterium]|nr:hypothetical protein [Synergistaceae bacterium]
MSFLRSTSNGQAGYTSHTAIRPGLYLLTVLLFTFLILPLTAAPARAATNVSYIDETGATKTCAFATDLSAGSATWTGWVYASGTLTIPSRVAVSGPTYLILADGADLTASAGITVNAGNSLTIYAQSTGSSMGKLTSTSTVGSSAGIGSVDATNCGTVTIAGGDVTASSTAAAAGIGGGRNGSGGTITITGGNVAALGGQQSAGIGGGFSGSGGTITITNGTVTAYGRSASGDAEGAGIGGGSNGNGGTITITGGTVTAYSNYGSGDAYGAGIGGGRTGAGGNIKITGGTVTAYGSNTGVSYGAGIGGGYSQAGGNITITNWDTLTASQTKAGTLGGTIKPEAIGHGAENSSVTGIKTSAVRILTQPQSTTCVQGFVTGSLTVSADVQPASSASALSFQWYSSASNSNSGGAVVTGATSATFPIPKGLTATTYYYCVVSAASTTTAPATTIAAAVTLTSPPAGGGSGTLTWNDATKTWTANGDVTLPDGFVIGPGETLDIPGGSTVTIPAGATVTNNGTIKIEDG